MIFTVQSRNDSKVILRVFFLWIILTARDKAVKEAFAAGEIEDDDIVVIKVLR